MRVCQFGSSETGAELQKLANSGLFYHLRGGTSDLGTAWLTSEDSNSHIPDLKKPFEMSGEFPHGFPVFEAGDFRLPTRPRSADRTSSPTRVSSKREYHARTFGIYGQYPGWFKGRLRSASSALPLRPQSGHSAARFACPKSAQTEVAVQSVRCEDKLAKRANLPLRHR
jgi:hypothetical protein